ncbi:MAG TPA: haloacid dehalogenase type II [Candidatus Binataceae bacterium]|nr:haloacid dehalogenase type II [Candidatus Binataceae bacterium]
MTPIKPTDFAFDIYGTIIDPFAIRQHLERLIGSTAEAFTTLWREKQLEYSFRRGLMGRYEPFSTCTRQALIYCSQVFGVPLSAQAERELLEQYQRLPAYPDARPALEKLKHNARKVIAFSNGEEKVVRALLANQGLLDSFDAVISVDEVQSFKPDPRVYQLLAARLGGSLSDIWMVSSNPFDVIGAKHAGLRAAWIRRRTTAVFDPWGLEPDLAVQDLNDFAARIEPALRSKA